MDEKAKKKGCVALLRLFVVSLEAGCYSSFSRVDLGRPIEICQSVLPQIHKHSHQNCLPKMMRDTLHCCSAPRFW